MITHQYTDQTNKLSFIGKTENLPVFNDQGLKEFLEKIMKNGENISHTIFDINELSDILDVQHKSYNSETNTCELFVYLKKHDIFRFEISSGTHMIRAYLSSIQQLSYLKQQLIIKLNINNDLYFNNVLVNLNATPVQPFDSNIVNKLEYK